MIENQFSAVVARGDAVIEIDGLSVSDVTHGLVAEDQSRIIAKRFSHEQKPEDRKGGKSFAGFSFSKGDHLEP